MRIHFLYAATLSLALTACASLGLVAPQSLDESLAYAQSQVSALELSAAQSAPTGKLSAADLQAVLSFGDQATAAITAAHAAESIGDTATAQSKLALATSLLAQLSAYLTAHGVK
jgi:hypothetical protein